MPDLPPPSRFAVVKRSLWQIVRAGTGRTPVEGDNYSATEGPRYARPTCAHGEPRGHARIRVVSFNINHGREVDRAAALFRRDASLKDADLVLLQEMEESGTERLASALGMSYVYYPAGRHPLSSRHFGNAILARGEIVDDGKHLLPHLGRVRGTRRIAVAATLDLCGQRLTALNVHLATLLDASLAAQRDQLLKVLEVADEVDGPVVIGGDFNRRSLGLVVERRGYQWLSREAGATLGPFAIDHLFARGLDPGVPYAAGVVRNTDGASDHRPVWSEITLAP
ncbi:MAG: endonuclease/exonuclease/phosphatase family protein [Gemmatimonadaceae bacterium]